MLLLLVAVVGGALLLLLLVLLLLLLLVLLATLLCYGSCRNCGRQAQEQERSGGGEKRLDSAQSRSVFLPATIAPQPREQVACPLSASENWKCSGVFCNLLDS